MTTSNHLSPGMILQIENKLFKVQAAIKVTLPKGGPPYIKATLTELSTQGKTKSVEKSFKLNQTLKEVNLEDRILEFLYLEGKDYLFLDIKSLDEVLISSQIIGEASNYLKEGVEITASFHNGEPLTIHVPQFLEIMIAEIDEKPNQSGKVKAHLETGAVIFVPSYIQSGDIIKIDTYTNEYMQRV